MTLPRGVALTCLFRTVMINAATTTRGMQQLGLAYELAPAFACLYPKTEDRAKAFARYAEHSNTHVFMQPAYAGILLNLETQIAAGKIPEKASAGLRQPIATTLSALGDALFSGSVRAFWALSCALLLLYGLPSAAIGGTLFLLLLLQAFRITSFFYCLKSGVAALSVLKKINLMTIAGYIKCANALLTGLLLWPIAASVTEDWSFELQTGLLLLVPACAWLIGNVHIPRPVILVLLITLFCLMNDI